MIDRAVAEGWEHRRACQYLELDEGRAWRWRRRRGEGCLDDGKPGAALHGLRPEEVTVILELFEQWGDVDRSHRKLAHRGSYTHKVWVSDNGPQMTSGSTREFMAMCAIAQHFGRPGATSCCRFAAPSWPMSSRLPTAQSRREQQ